MDTTTIEKATAPEEAICILLDPPGLIVAGPGMEGWCNVLETVLCRALSDKGILGKQMPGPDNGFQTAKEGANMFAYLNSTIGVFSATSLGALETIRAELEKAALLPYAQIGWHDRREGIWMRYYPAGLSDSFPDPIVLIRKYIAMIDARQKRVA
jgi:hypothetical protein